MGSRPTTSLPSSTISAATTAPIRTPEPICGAWLRNWTTRPSPRSPNTMQARHRPFRKKAAHLPRKAPRSSPTVLPLRTWPCQSCHGEHAEGNGVFPRLAGQHADYLKKQLEAFRSSLRESDVMHVESKDMT